MVLFRQPGGFKIPELKLRASTLVESIVAMLIVSIFLTLGGLVSFNLYKSIPRNDNLRMEVLAHQVLDSLVQSGVTDRIEFLVGDYGITYAATEWQTNSEVLLCQIVVRDTLGYEIFAEKLMPTYED